MPIAGTLDVTPLLDGAPRMASLDAQPWEIARVETLQLMFEIDDRDMGGLLPKALHPTIPPVVMISVARYQDSPAGAFVLAQVRIVSSTHPRPAFAIGGEGCRLDDVRASTMRRPGDANRKTNRASFSGSPRRRVAASSFHFWARSCLTISRILSASFAFGARLRYCSSCTTARSLFFVSM